MTVHVGMINDMIVAVTDTEAGARAACREKAAEMRCQGADLGLHINVHEHKVQRWATNPDRRLR